MSTAQFMRLASVLVMFISFLVSPLVYALEWQNLWSTPEQRASRQLDSEQYDNLIKQAPNANWRGVGEYRKGDYAAAIESFSQQRETAALSGSATETEQAMYNQANALTLNENYAEAIDLFDQVLQLNPEHIDAKHNRAIAEQLLEQQKQQEQDQQNSDDQSQEGEQSEGEEGEGEEGEQSSDDQQQSDQEQSDQQDSEQQQSDENQSAQSSEDNAQAAEDSASQQEQAEQEAQAARAMQAEQAEAGSPENADNEATEEAAPTGDELAPEQLTEKEQANEQWLRQIPDDPAGLLQRKLQNRHLTDFPKVKDSVNPW